MTLTLGICRSFLKISTRAQCTPWLWLNNSASLALSWTCDSDRKLPLLWKPVLAKCFCHFIVCPTLRVDMYLFWTPGHAHHGCQALQPGWVSGDPSIVQILRSRKSSPRFVISTLQCEHILPNLKIENRWYYIFGRWKIQGAPASARGTLLSC